MLLRKIILFKNFHSDTVRAAHATVYSWRAEDSFDIAPFHLSGFWGLTQLLTLFQQAPLSTDLDFALKTQKSV